MKLRSAAKVLIRRSSDGKYLILRSSEWSENPRRSQKPDFPGGEIESNESLTQGLLREIKEETGIIVDEDALQLVYASTYADTTEDISTTFLIYYTELADPEVILSWEHEAYMWLSAEDVTQLSIREPYPTIIQHFKKVGLL